MEVGIYQAAFWRYGHFSRQIESLASHGVEAMDF